MPRLQAALDDRRVARERHERLRDELRRIRANRVAHALERPVATSLKGVAVDGDRVRCEQEVPGGRDVFDLPLPAVVTVKEGLNFPRYPSVPGRMRAQKKPVAASSPSPGPARLEKARLVVPPGERKEAEILGHGPEAAPRVLEVLQRIGVA